MKLQMSTFKSLLLVTTLTLPGLAMAQSFPCGLGNPFQCNAPASPAADKALSARDDTVALVLKGMNLQNVALTDEQRNTIANILNSQAPEIIDHVKAIEAANGYLREMAVLKRYDDVLASALVKAIAENSANLALLQAAREYQVFDLLTPEQVKGLKVGRNG